jgi:hypothetical protein
LSRAPATFRQGDVTRAIKAAKQSGLPVARVEIDRAGRIVVVIGEAADNEKAATPFDKLPLPFSPTRKRRGSPQ